MLLGFILSGCQTDVELTPVLEDNNYHTETFSVFTGVIDGVETDFKFEDFTCNGADLFTYRLSDNAAVLNADSTQVTCTTNLSTRTQISETVAPLYGG